MKEKRNDFRNQNRQQSKRSFYTAAGAVLACTAVLAGVYFQTGKTGRQLTQQAQNAPAATAAGESAIRSAEKADAEEQESTQASTTLNAGDKSARATRSPKKDVKVKANKKVQAKENTDAKKAKATMAAGKERVFQEESGLTWPVKGDVLMKFSQTNNIYFKTLAQYKSNPAIEISAEEGTKVIASAAGTVTKISKDDITGSMVTTDIGSNYEITYGQLKDIRVSKGDEIKEGQLLGKVAAPTKYFSEEGSNLFFQVKEDGNAVDPLLLLN